MQARFAAGDTLSYTRSLADYPAGDGWALTLRMVPRESGTAITVVGTASGDDHQIDAAAATTATWLPGVYSWTEFATLGAASYTVAQGSVTLLANPRTTTAPFDTRTDAQIALDNVRATLRGKASADVLRYTIAGRSLERYSIPDLIALESKLAADVQRENAAAARAAGRPDPRNMQVRLGRA